MKNRRNKKNETGFTLIEIIATVVIIGILISLVAGTYLNRIEKARSIGTKANIKTISDQIMMYKMEKGEYPEDLTELVPDYIPSADSLVDGWEQGFLYYVPGENGPFDIVSGGPDRDTNTPEDNINSWELRKKPENSVE